MTNEKNQPKKINLNWSLPREYFTIDEPKHMISKVIFDATINKNLSLRTMSKQIKELYSDGSEDVKKSTPHHNTLQQITSGGNYKIDNLLMLLDLLGKEIVIVDRKPETVERIKNRKKTPFQFNVVERDMDEKKKEELEKFLKAKELKKKNEETN